MSRVGRRCRATGEVRSNGHALLRRKSKVVFLMPAMTGMKGAGCYDQHSGAQLSAIQAFQDWVDDAAISWWLLC